MAIMRIFAGFASSMGIPLMRLIPSTTMWLVARGSRSAFPLQEECFLMLPSVPITSSLKHFSSFRFQLGT